MLKLEANDSVDQFGDGTVHSDILTRSWVSTRENPSRR